METEVRKRVSGSLQGSERATGRLRPSTPLAQPSEARTEIKSEQEAVSFQHKLASPEYNTAMVHFYRGELSRANTWRNRLDTTTNWAVITTGATLSFSFGDPFAPHFVILINTVVVAFFLFMEARRYRYYEIWSSRVRMIETGYFARILSRDAQTTQDWAEHLVSELQTPHFTISEWEALGRRLRRNYLWLFALLAASWNLKVYLHPIPAADFRIFIDRATIGVLPGSMVLYIGVLFNLTIITFAIATIRLREATGEVLPRHQFSLPSFSRVKAWTRDGPRRATERRAKRARHRVRTTSSLATGEYRRIDISETPDRRDVKEEILK